MRKYSALLFIICLVALGATSKAKQGVRKVSKVATFHYEKAKEYETNNDNPLAEDEYKKALSINKGFYPQAWRDFSFYLSYHLRFSESAKALGKYIQQSKKVEKEDFERLENLQKASSLSEKVSSVEKPNLKSLIDFSKLVYLLGKNKSKDALPFAKRAVDLYPDSIEALILLSTYLENSNSPNRGLRLTLLEKALAIDQYNIEVHYQLGNYYFFYEPDVARRYYSKALDLSAGMHPESWQGIARIYKRFGLKNEAIAAFRNYLKLGRNLGPYRAEIENEIRVLEGK